MSDTAEVNDGTGERTGLNYLDITKHAVKTIMKVLGPNDLCSLVAYTTDARVVFENVAVTDSARKGMIKKLEALEPEATTNIWAGLHLGMECIRKVQEKDATRQGSIILLTDGIPNAQPPRGEVYMMKKYMDTHPNLRFVMNTIGFGYDLDSPLLINIAKAGNGTYAFIPDPSLVGTVFVNLTSNLLTTMSDNVTISLETENGAKIVKVFGQYEGSMESYGWQGSIGALTYEQNRGLVVEIECPKGTDTPYLSVTANYPIRGSVGNKCELTQQIKGVTDSATEIDRLHAEKFRLLSADIIFAAMSDVTVNSGARDFDKLPAAQEKIAALLSQMAKSGLAARVPRTKDLIQDISGQVAEAFSKRKVYDKWGRHYLPSLARAHLYQQCNNFKDPGVQHYGGSSFKKVQHVADDIFVNMPPPKPSINVAKRSAPINMAHTYYNNCGGCFDGGNRVEMADGSFKLVRLCKKGDEVRTCNGKAKIRCVMKTIVSPEAAFCELPSGLLLTPWHPVRIKNEWVFPNSLAAVTMRKCDAYYNFVLEKHHSMFIESTEAVTLGHNFKDNKVIAHPYFGSQAVVQDLQSFEGWKKGLVIFNKGCLRRSQKTGL
eukprot:TRINITY_DN50_c0_g1_i5.p1 TRINITY_DN50_c0_g1~~TRINITY_DN50_c0_g1_i5.p1  ORF type:complete len:603 (+),score=103.34 TRINITY_DN50_c0_g1_i5:158-1966(+)